MLGGCLIGLTTAFGSSFVKNFWAFLGLYACGFGLCNAFAVRSVSKLVQYIVPIYNSWKYFPDNKGLAGGIVLAGFGFGPFVFNFISTALVNPNNLKPNDQGYFPPEVADNVPYMLRSLVYCWTAIAVVGILMIFPYEEAQKEERQLTNYIDSTEDLAQEQQPVIKQASLKDCFTSPQFGITYLMTCLSICKPISQSIL